MPPATAKPFDELRTPNARARRLRLARESRQRRGVLSDPLASGQAPPPVSARTSLRRAGAVVDRAATRTAAGGRGAGARVAAVYQPGTRRAGDLLVWTFATILGLAFLEAALSGRGPAGVQKFLGLLGGGISKLVDPHDPLFGKTSPPPETASAAGLPTSVTGPSSTVAPGPSGEHPGPGAGHLGRNAGGFLRRTAVYVPGRSDQGRDGQTGPNEPIIAPGSGKVVAVKSDPGGFGPAYPVVKFSSGPYAGKTLYVGHRISALRVGARFRAGQVIAKPAPHGLGNATAPGWFEIGFAPGGSPGQMGQPTPF